MLYVTFTYDQRNALKESVSQLWFALNTSHIKIIKFKLIKI